MEIVADVRERVLRGFALDVAKLVDATALDGCSRPDLPDGPPQPGIAVDDAEQRSSEAPGYKIVEAAFPRGERLASTQLQGQQVFAPVGKDADHTQHWRAYDLPATAHTQGEAIEVDVDHPEIVERTRTPRLQPAFERGHHPRDRALRERRGLEQRLQRPTDPALVAPGQVRADHRFVDLAHPPLVARHNRRGPFLPTARRRQGRPRERERQRPGRARQGANLDAVAVSASNHRPSCASTVSASRSSASPR